jgi:hypothetical protein
MQTNFLATGFALLAVVVPLQGWAETERCTQIGGVLAGNLIELMTFVGTVTGQLQGAAQANITKLEKNEDTFQLELKHIFITVDRNVLRTTDKAVWIPIPDKPGVYHMHTRHTIAGGTGKFAQAQGSFESDGEVDTNQDLVTLGYSGQLCGVGTKSSRQGRAPDAVQPQAPKKANKAPAVTDACGVGKGGRIGGGSAGLLDLCFRRGEK